MKKYLVLFCCLAFSIRMQAQSTPDPYVPNVIPPSPNASTLMKFADVPVSPYTGASDVTVPLYTLQSRGITIPIILDYHTGGIRLKEEAGVVGLGWSLNAGGAISRTVNNYDDFYHAYFDSPGLPRDVPQIEGDLADLQLANSPAAAFDVNKYVFCFACSDSVHFANGQAGDYTNLFTSGTADAEPDSYSYNFLGHSGKFFIKKDYTVVLQKQDNIRIEIINTSGYNYIFRVTDENGNKYIFDYIENSYSHSFTTPAVSSWYLTHIVTQQNNTITFNYTTPSADSLMQDVSQNYRLGCIINGWSNLSYGSTSYDNVNLQSIEDTSGKVQFFYSGSREDLAGGTKLDSIRVYSKTVTGLHYLKTQKLYYSYFFPGTNSRELERLKLDSIKEFSGSVGLKPYSFGYNNLVPGAYGEKHSYSIDHWGYYNGAGNTSLVPSFSAQMPADGIVKSPSSYVTFSGANREPDSAKMKIFMLNQVTYPTGGKSAFVYDANTYDHDQSIVSPVEYEQVETVEVDTVIHINTYGASSGTIHFSKLAQIIPSGFAGTDAHVNIAFVRTGSTATWPSSVINTFGNLYCNVTGPDVTVNEDINDNTLVCGVKVCSTNPDKDIAVSVQSDTAYTWNAYVDSSIPDTVFSEIHLEIKFTALRTAINGNPTLTAGGLRVRSITDYAASGVVAKKRFWDYGHGSTDQYSFGRLMSFPSYAHLEMLPGFYYPGDGATCEGLTLFSSSISSLSSVITGNVVGYSQVAEYTVDPSTSADNGKIVYKYFNSPDSTIFYNGLRPPGTLNMGNNLNGSLLSKTIYKNAGSGAYWKLSETKNYYRTTNRHAFYTVKYTSWTDVSGNLIECSRDSLAHGNTFLGYFYPFMKSERVLLDSARNIIYDPADTTKFLVNTTKNFYDNTKHYQLTRSKFVDSKGDTYVTKTTYPQDYITSGDYTGNTILDSLIARNMVAETIEKRDSLYLAGSSTGNVLSATESRYKQLGSGTMVQDKVYKLDIVNPVNNFVPMSISGDTYSHDSRYRQLISFAYDTANNIAQYTEPHKLPVSIIWDYNHTLPIAQVKNGAQSDVAYTSFEGDGTGNWTVGSTDRDSTIIAVTGTASYNLSSGDITKTGLNPATTYVVSYWSNNDPLSIAGTISGYPITGTTALSDWTYCEHLVTGKSTITLTGSANIDELRLYPQNAQMTSYTYKPLVGVTSVSDVRGGITYYDYDAFQRLVNVRDQNGNIVKNFVYHYAGQ